MGTTRVTLAELSAMEFEAFTEVLGGVFEHSLWVARGAWPARPFEDLASLHAAMVEVVHSATEERQLALVRAHPELAGKAAAEGTLTRESTAEQASAGLDRCTPEELEAIAGLNRAYREKHGFPFIMAVRGATRAAVLESMAERAANETEAELARSLEEIGRIARMRLEALIGE